EEVFAAASSSGDKRFEEVDEMVSAVMRFPDDRLATFACSFGAADRSAYEGVGTKGSLRMDPAYEMVGDLKCEVTVDGRTTKKKYAKRDQFGPELVYFSDCILNNKEPEPNGNEGLADVRIINALEESKEKGRPVKLSKVEVTERPDGDQEITKPAIGKP